MSASSLWPFLVVVQTNHQKHLGVLCRYKLLLETLILHPLFLIIGLKY